MKHQIIRLSAENYQEYDLFCKKSQKKKPGYQKKEKWILDRFNEGLVIYLLQVDTGQKTLTSRGFIEYMPGEKSWRSVIAPNYLVIHCIWVTGKYKEHGYGSKLLEKCLHEAKAQKKDGVVVVASTKHWLPKNNLFTKHGFHIVDEYPPLSLMVKKFHQNVSDPSFILKSSEDPLQYMEQAGLDQPLAEGLTIFYANQCPYMHNLINQIRNLASKHKLQFSDVEITNRQQVEAFPHPYGTCAIFYKKQLLSYSYEKDAKYEELMQKIDEKN